MRFWVYIPPNNRNVPPMSLLKMSCKTANFLLLEGRYITGAEHKEKPANPDKSRVYELLRSGASGDTELFEKASNINGFQGGRVANNLYISPFRATVFKTAALFLYLNSSVVIRVRKPLFFPL